MKSSACSFCLYIKEAFPTFWQYRLTASPSLFVDNYENSSLHVRQIKSHIQYCKLTIKSIEESFEFMPHFDGVQQIIVFSVLGHAYLILSLSLWGVLHYKTMCIFSKEDEKRKAKKFGPCLWQLQVFNLSLLFRLRKIIKLRWSACIAALVQSVHACLTICVRARPFGPPWPPTDFLHIFYHLSTNSPRISSSDILLFLIFRG